MIIRTDTWHYKVWKFYKTDGGPQLNGSDAAPPATNLCEYVQTLFFGTFMTCLLGPMAALIVIAIALVIFIVPLVLGFGIFRIWKLRRSDFKRFAFPTPLVVSGLWVVIALGYLGTTYPQKTFAAGESIVTGVEVLVPILVAVGIIAVVVDSFRKWEVSKLLKAYLKAKKERVCPLITFVPAK